MAITATADAVNARQKYVADENVFSVIVVTRETAVDIPAVTPLGTHTHTHTLNLRCSLSLPLVD